MRTKGSIPGGSQAIGKSIDVAILARSLARPDPGWRDGLALILVNTTAPKCPIDDRSDWLNWEK
jgi:hypothetical protein